MMPPFIILSIRNNILSDLGLGFFESCLCENEIRNFYNIKIVNEKRKMRREDTTSLVEGGKANDAILYVHSFHNFLTAATGTDKTKIRFYLALCTKKWIRPLTPC